MNHEKGRLGFEILDHTADVAIRVWAPGLKALFEEAVRGMCFLISKNIAKPQQCETISITGENEEELFLNCLREVLFLIEGGMLVQSFVITEENFIRKNEGPLRIAAEVSGEKIDPERHDICMEIKAVTRHGLRVWKKDPLWEAQVLFDI